MIKIFLLFSLILYGCTKPLSEEEAFNKIENLNEVKNFAEQIEKADENVKAIIRLEKSDNPDLYEFYVGEDHETHTVAWNRFAIHKKTGKILIFDILNAEFIPLEKCARIEARCIKSGT